MLDKKLTDSKKIAKWQKEKLGEKTYNEPQEKAKQKRKAQAITDNEIKKAFEKCIEEKLKPSILLMVAVFDLINRQKAEIERLQNENTLLTQNSLANKYPLCIWIGDNLILSKSEQNYDKLIANIKSEAYKECIEKMKEKSCKLNMCHNDVVVKTDYQISGEALDNLF